MKIYSILLFFLNLGFSNHSMADNMAAKNIKEFCLKNMKVRLQKRSSFMFIQIKAKTRGWVLVGFNSRNEVMGADLKMLRLGTHGVETSDRKTVGPGRNYPSDQELGGDNQIKVVQNLSSEDNIHLTFTIPLETNDANDFDHRKHADYYLILAWSVSKDWQHHSRQRQHFVLSWKK